MDKLDLEVFDVRALQAKGIASAKALKTGSVSGAGNDSKKAVGLETTDEGQSQSSRQRPDSLDFILRGIKATRTAFLLEAV